MAAPRPRTMPTSASGTGSATFADLGLPVPLVDALASVGINRPFPIQADTLPDSLRGRDVLGRGRTGSGKTYAFLLAVAARLAHSGSKRAPGRPRGLILAPTRELASQIAAAMAPLSAGMSLRTLTIFGGVPAGPQIRGLRTGVDVIVACPGRLADLMNQGHADLSDVEITVLDEADHMADLGFLPVVRRLLDQTPRASQRLLFSATLDAGVDLLVKRYLNKPIVHSVDSAQSPVATMHHHVFHVDGSARLPVITDLAAAPGRTLIFTRTKHGATALARKLNACGVRAVELHGNLSQNARSRNLASFSSGVATTLVATDIAARGIHVDDISLVIHADPPVEHKAYLHRSGRTARAGAHGTVVTMMLDTQGRQVRDITRKAGITPVTTRVSVGDPILQTVAPGDRAYTSAPSPRAAGRSDTGRADSRGRRRRRRPGTSAPNSRSANAGAAKRGGQSGGRSGGQGGGQRGRGAPSPSGRPSRTRNGGSFSAGGRKH